MDDTEYLLKTLNAAKSASLMKKNLTPAIQTQLKGRKTKLGGTLGDCIRSGLSFILQKVYDVLDDITSS